MRVRAEIGPQHPALPGHFPGNPIVPGVVILRRVCRALTDVRGGVVTAVPVVRFHAPLRPAESIDMELEDMGGSSVRFRVMRGQTLIASGTLQVGPVAAEPSVEKRESPAG